MSEQPKTDATFDKAVANLCAMRGLSVRQATDFLSAIGEDVSKVAAAKTGSEMAALVGPGLQAWLAKTRRPRPKSK